MGKVAVFGAINQDVIALCERRPRAGETVLGSALLHLPGGVGANQAVAVASAETECVLIGAVGDDPAGTQLIAFLNERDVDTTHVRTIDDAPTGTAIIVVDASGENNIVIVPGANNYASDSGAVEFQAGDVLLTQFEIRIETIAPFFERGRRSGCINVLNPSPAAPLAPELAALVDVCVLNESELKALSGVPVDVNDEQSIIQAARSLLPGNATVVVTLGDRGAIAIQPDREITVHAAKVDVVDTTGAGDCFVGSLAACLATGRPIRDALDYANRAAAISVTRQGAGPSMPTRKEVLS